MTSKFKSSKKSSSPISIGIGVVELTLEVLGWRWSYVGVRTEVVADKQKTNFPQKMSKKMSNLKAPITWLDAGAAGAAVPTVAVGHCC